MVQEELGSRALKPLKATQGQQLRVPPQATGSLPLIKCTHGICHAKGFERHIRGSRALQLCARLTERSWQKDLGEQVKCSIRKATSSLQSSIWMVEIQISSRLVQKPAGNQSLQSRLVSVPTLALSPRPPTPRDPVQSSEPRPVSSVVVASSAKTCRCGPQEFRPAAQSCSLCKLGGVALSGCMRRRNRATIYRVRRDGPVLRLRSRKCGLRRRPAIG